MKQNWFIYRLSFAHGAIAEHTLASRLGFNQFHDFLCYTILRPHHPQEGSFCPNLRWCCRSLFIFSFFALQASCSTTTPYDLRIFCPQRLLSSYLKQGIFFDPAFFIRKHNGQTKSKYIVSIISARHIDCRRKQVRETIICIYVDSDLLMPLVKG